MAVIQLDDGIKIPISKTKQLLLLIYGLPILALAIWVLYRVNHGAPHPMLNLVLGLITLSFFGLAATVALISIFYKGSGLYINSKGINMSTPMMKNAFLSWSEIAGFGDRRMGLLNKLIIVHLKNPNAFLERLNSFQRRSGKANMALAGSPYSINANSLDCSCHELIEILQTNFEKYKS